MIVPIFILISSFITDCWSMVYPLQFCIPEVKIVREIPTKDRDFAFIIPGDRRTYIYKNEEAYYRDYQRSYYALTTKKEGWDCLRHYEILANGCIPYFVDLDNCPTNTMAFLPKDLIREAMNLEGVSHLKINHTKVNLESTPYLKIDHSKFNRSKYYELLNKLLIYTREHLTTRSMAEYLLNTLNYSGTGKILFLSGSTWPDYLRDLTLIGLKEILKDKVVDSMKISQIYKGFTGSLPFGSTFTYTQIVDDLPVDRGNIEQRIMNREFELIIYGAAHAVRGFPYHDLVRKVYRPEEIAYLCGEDLHECTCKQFHNLFLREWGF